MGGGTSARSFASWLARAWAGLCAAGLVALLLLGAAELAARALSGSGGGGPRATADALVEQPQAEAMLAEVYSGQIRTRFAPFVHYRLEAFEGEHIRMDAEGWRQIPGTRTGTAGPEVWVFGGSTVWGMGARDEGTIPAHLARALGPKVRVENLGQVGYMSTQEVLTLLHRLQAGRRPDVVVFYDGVNEVLPVLKLGRVGVPLDVPRRAREFNLTRPGEQGRLLSEVARSLAESSVLAKKVLSSRASPPPVRVEAPEAAAARIVRSYAANVHAVAGLAERYGFHALFFWQPTVFSKRARSEDEAAAARLRADFEALYRSSARRVRSELAGQVVDLSDAFGEDPAPVFFDFCHVNEAGNQRLAARIAPYVQAALRSPRAPRATSP